MTVRFREDLLTVGSAAGEDRAETDPRFPSGPWVGFFLQRFPLNGKFRMDLLLTFREGILRGEGRDFVGDFIFRGRYDVADGRCHWTKRYLGRHDVYYSGFNEGKGIWGRWEIPHGPEFVTPLHGGFHIWPKAVGDPTAPGLAESADVPVEQEVVVRPFSVPVGRKSSVGQSASRLVRVPTVRADPAGA